MDDDGDENSNSICSRGTQPRRTSLCRLLSTLAAWMHFLCGQYAFNMLTVLFMVVQWNLSDGYLIWRTEMYDNCWRAD